MTVFSKALLKWFKGNARDLPWRRTSDPYKIWISEIMLQQTTVATVMPKYEAWIKQFPSIESVANASEQEVLKAWQGLGYYARARNIQKTAKIVSEKHQGKLPTNPVELRQLPGFGPYTVGAVASIAFNLPEPIVDANVRRVMMRLKATQRKLSTEFDSLFYKDLKKHLTPLNANPFNQGLMELGALICKPKNPICIQCPLNYCCVAYKKGIQELIPQTNKKKLKDLAVAVAVIKDGNKFFIQRRLEKGVLYGLWEFPGGKIEKGETPLQAVHREIKEEVGCALKDVKFFKIVKHFYTQYRISLHVFTCSSVTKIPQSKDHKWLNLTDLIKDYPMPSGSAKILQELVKRA